MITAERNRRAHAQRWLARSLQRTIRALERELKLIDREIAVSSADRPLSSRCTT